MIDEQKRPFLLVCKEHCRLNIWEEKVRTVSAKLCVSPCLGERAVGRDSQWKLIHKYLPAAKSMAEYIACILVEKRDSLPDKTGVPLETVSV